MSDKNDFYNRQREEVSWNWKIQNIHIFGREKTNHETEYFVGKTFRRQAKSTLHFSDKDISDEVMHYYPGHQHILSSYNNFYYNSFII